MGNDKIATAAPVAEQGYSYQRANGTVEHARTAEDAIRLCPVLGKLAMEAPDQANILLELAAAGNEIMAAETEEESLEPELLELEPEIKTESETGKKPAEAIEPKAEQLVTAESTVLEPEQQFVADYNESGGQHSQQKEALGIGTGGDVMEAGQGATRPGVVTPDRRAETAPPTADSSRETAAPIKPVDVRIQQQPEAEASESFVTKSLMSEKVMTETAIPTVENDEALEVSPEPIVEEVKTAIDMLGVEAPTAENETASPDDVLETDTDKQPEPQFSPETIEVYEQLEALVEIETDQSATPEVEGSMAVEPEAEMEVIASEEPASLEIIQEQADKQPLEQTLSQLVEFLRVPAEAQEQNTLQDILREIEETLPVRHSHEQAEVKPQITPEMTEKLLVLLRTLGYQNPREALVDFVAQNGITSLLQSLDYICRLNNDSYRQEFFVASSASFANDSDAARLRPSKGLFALLGRAAFGFSV